MFQFIEENCCKNIRSLILKSFYNTINKNYMELIGDQIKALDVLALGATVNVNFQWDRFKNIRVLYNASHYDERRWLAKQFPNLQILCLLFMAGLKTNYRILCGTTEK